MKRADSLLAPFIREYGIEDGIKLSDMKKNWFRIFNKPLSYHMSPCKLSKGELLLNVDSPVWLQELNFYKEDIVKKLSRYNVTIVRFKLGKVSNTEKTKAGSQKQNVRSLNFEEQSFIEETVSCFNDVPLKGLVKTTIEKAITTGKTKISG